MRWRCLLRPPLPPIPHPLAVTVRPKPGSAIGAAAGYGAANRVKNRDYRSAARVAGGVIGAVAGTAVQKGLSGRTAVEIYVRDLSDRRQRILAVVQDADVDVREGDQVFLVGKGSKTRVVPIARMDVSPWGGGENASACGVGACGVSLGDMR